MKRGWIITDKLDSILNITNEWLEKPNEQLLPVAMAALDNPGAVQERLLLDIIATAINTEIGHKFSFGEIGSVREFQQRMPLTDWSDVEPYSDRMIEGEGNLLFPGNALQFVKTSGTTGKDKFIPESSMSESARALIQKLRFVQYIKNVPELGEMLLHPQKAKRCLLPLTNAPVWSKTPAGIPCVSASGLTLGQTGLDNLMAFPMYILLNSDSESRDYLLIRLAIENPDILVVAGNNAGRLTSLIRMAQQNQEEILTDIENGTIVGAKIVDAGIAEKLTILLHPNPERAKALRILLSQEKPFTPETYWPHLELGLFWLSASVGKYVDELRPLLPPLVRMMDVGYGSSEAKFNIPLIPEDASGVLSIATTFFEFMPIDADKDNFVPLLCHELEVGKQYELIVTTWGGLYRYKMKDVVQVCGFIGKTPKIIFIAKSCEVLNICGEKFYPEVVSVPIKEALALFNLCLRQLQIYPDYEKKNYICYVEVIGNAGSVSSEQITAKAHACFVATSMRYKMNLTQGILKPIKVILMKQGWQQSLYDERIKPDINISQIKIPVVISNQIDNKWIL